MKSLTPNQENELKTEIKRLHEKKGGDFESLLKQVEKHRKIVPLNLPQYIAAISPAKTKILEWGRGTGKTTYRGVHWSNIMSEMPRSTGLFIGPSYQFILTRIIPSLVQGLEMFGIYRDLHYFIGTQPPRSWRKSWVKAYQPPAKYDRYITFWNGVGVHLISHDVAGDGRGLNADWIDGDEAGYLKANALQENTDPTLRGTKKAVFQKSQYFGSRIYTSSTPLTAEGQWFIDYEDKAVHDPDNIAFIKATCEHNLENLREGYLQEAAENAYQYWVYLAEYKNVRPKFTKNSFYNLLDPDLHLYSNFDYDFYVQPGQAVDCRGDLDLVAGVPLILSGDWGAAINCMTINQHLKSVNEYRTLKSMYVLGDEQKIQDDLFKNFHNYYKLHQSSCKEIYFHYDKGGNQETGHTKATRAEQARKQLTELGWKVHLMTTGTINVEHYKKYLLWQKILKEQDRSLPRYRMNRDNCRELYLSMRNAKTKQGSSGEIKKDKSSEKNSKIPRQEATDLSDANDNAIWSMFNSYLYNSGMLLPSLHIKSN